MAKRKTAKTRGTPKSPGKQRRKSSRLKTARKAGVAGARTGTNRGRKTKAAKAANRKAPARRKRRTAPDRLPPIEMVFGGLPVLPERGLDPNR